MKMGVCPNIPRVLRFVVTVLILVGPSLSFADSVGISDISIDPIQPTNIDLIGITTSGWVGYVFDVQFVDSESHISGNSINIDFYFYDSNPGGIGLPVAGGWDSTVNIGPLSPGIYGVSAKAWITEDLFPVYRLADMDSTSFTVIPEPATLFLFGLSGLVLRRKHRVLQ